LGGGVVISELVDNLEEMSACFGTKRSAGATNRWDEIGGCVGWHCDRSKNEDLEPALPVGKCLVNKLLVVVGSNIGRVMLEAFHNEFTLFGSKEVGGGWMLRDESMTTREAA
jgi:hypothetical protein